MSNKNSICKNSASWLPIYNIISKLAHKYFKSSLISTCNQLITQKIWVAQILPIKKNYYDAFTTTNICSYAAIFYCYCCVMCIEVSISNEIRSQFVILFSANHAMTSSFCCLPYCCSGKGWGFEIYVLRFVESHLIESGYRIDRTGRTDPIICCD